MPLFNCLILGVSGSAFSVIIEEWKTVALLKKAIKVEKANDYKDVDADKLHLFAAKTVDDKWLASSTEDGEDYISDLLAGMETPEGRQIHMLVVVSEQAQTQTRLWLVSGFIENALDTKGIRCFLYRLASSRLGCYDPARRIGDKDVAFWYEDNRLCIHVLFKTEKAARKFGNDLNAGPHTLGSPLSGQAITCQLTRVEAVSTELQRIKCTDYDPHESDSPQNTLSSVSLSTSRSLLDPLRDEFFCMRIKHKWLFIPYGKVESCHLLSKKQCNDNKRQVGHYDRDPNNRLALSRGMHRFYYGLSLDIPIVNTLAVSVEKTPSFGSRYKVEVLVKVFDADCISRVFYRLKDGSTKTDDPLVMKTFVYVEDPNTFCYCMKWKHDYNEKLWKSFSDGGRLSRINEV
ncbi:unnamed protein product [Peronospora destructor]|uniref:Crinkler effector protein N-terminal domain-containing protein n=1 Tax=Peronospora destructor TaxID=86335 RepID=A0AAV0TFI7_9STRA|nr:unnamed protein product [Peronospora destructor]